MSFSVTGPLGTLVQAAWPKASTPSCIGSMKCLDGSRLLVIVDALSRQGIARV